MKRGRWRRSRRGAGQHAQQAKRRVKLGQAGKRASRQAPDRPPTASLASGHGDALPRAVEVKGSRVKFLARTPMQARGSPSRRSGSLRTDVEDKFIPSLGGQRARASPSERSCAARIHSDTMNDLARLPMSRLAAAAPCTTVPLARRRNSDALQWMDEMRDGCPFAHCARTSARERASACKLIGLDCLESRDTAFGRAHRLRPRSGGSHTAQAHHVDRNGWNGNLAAHWILRQGRVTASLFADVGIYNTEEKTTTMPTGRN